MVNVTLEEKITAFLAPGIGYGRGDGSGYGRGYGRGDGSGYGSGYGLLKFDGHLFHNIDGIPTAITVVRGNFAYGFTISDDFTKSDCVIAKVGNSFAHGKNVHEAYADALAKDMQSKPLEERIAETLKQHPDPTEIIPNKELFTLHNILTGSCEYGRRQFCENHNISLDGAMTMCDFINTTAKAYGGDAIRQLAEAYGITIKKK